MSGVAEYPGTALRRTALPFSELSISLTVSLVTVIGVGWALARTPSTTREFALPVFALGAGVMFGLGLTDLARARDVRFARALVLAGVLWSLSALTSSAQPALYSIGHIGQWLIALTVSYLLLSYPSGRLTERVDRMLIAGGAALVGLLYLPTALVVQQFPHPSLWSACTLNCPQNVFSLGNSTPAVIPNLVVPAREALTVALFVLVAVTVIRRARQAGPALGQLYAPIAAFAVFQALAWMIYFPLREIAPNSRTLPAMGWLFVLALPAAAVACGTGRLYRRIHAANVLDRAARNLRTSTNAADVRRALADALADPSLRILHSFPGDSDAWVDELGCAVPLPRTAGAGRVTQVSNGNWRIAVIHDPALAEDRGLLLSVGSYALAALENRCLTDELDQSIHDLAQTRAGRLAAEQDTRQKIERDLHDGAQQRLLALRLKLGLAASKLSSNDPAGAEVLHSLEHDVDETIDEIRTLARGIYPPLLARTGLRDALRAVARGAALPTTVDADRLGRYPAQTETTVYFCCSEALQNAVKHARTATRVSIHVWRDRELHFEVRDDGAGFDVRMTPYGTGLRNLSERLAAVGGSITIRSAPGHGTVLGGSIPLA